MEFFLGLIESSTFTFCAYTFYRWQKKQLKLQDMIEFVHKAAVMTPGMLKKTMEVGGPESLLKNMKNYEEGKNYSMGTAFVQGLVESEQVIRSLLNHSTNNNKNFEEANGKIDTKYVSEFKLVDASSADDSLVINNSSNVNYNDALHLIHSIVHMRSLSPLEKFLSWVLFCIKLFLSMSNVGKRLSGFKVGSKRVERGIMVGQFLVAFGEIIFDRHHKELRMSNPIFFMKDREQLAQRLREKRVALGRNMTLIFTVMVMLGFFLVKRLAKGVGSLVKKYQRLRQLNTLDNFYKINKIKTNDFRCSVCTENVRNVIFKPCLHLAVCSVCFEKMPERKCPTCRKPVEEVVNIFVV